MGDAYFLRQIYSEHECGSTARNSLAVVAFRSWKIKAFLTHNLANLDLKVLLNCVEKMEGDESMAHRTKNRLCKKSRDSRLLSLVPLLLLQRICDVVTGFAVS